MLPCIFIYLKQLNANQRAKLEINLKLKMKVRNECIISKDYFSGFVLFCFFYTQKTAT